MHEVTIPLRHVAEGEVAGTPEDCLRVVQDAYASQYLALLGIGATAANKAAVLRERPLDDCEIHAIWAEDGRLRGTIPNSARAEALKVVPPLRQRLAEFEPEGLGETTQDRVRLNHWYGQATRINVRPPDILGFSGGDGESGAWLGDVDGARTGGPMTAATVGGASLAGTLGPGQTTATALAAELDRMRQGSKAPAGPGRPALATAGTIGLPGMQGQRAAEGGPALSSSARSGGTADMEVQELELERKDRLRQELSSLKSKYVLPFACERVVPHGGGRTELCPWPTEGPLHLEVPPRLKSEVCQPIRLTVADVQRQAMKWVTESLPLELLTFKREERILTELRGALLVAEVHQLTGLLAHLLYWLALGVNRPEGERSLSDAALSALSTSAHELWGALEKDHRDSALGVSLVLPTLVLTLKRGVEKVFEVQYPNLMNIVELKQKVIDRINTLVMRLFDPDGTYARFGKFDGSGKAISLTKRLDMLSASGGGRTRAKRLCSIIHRSTPLVKAVLETAQPTEAVPSGTGCYDARTRALLVHGELAGPPPSAPVAGRPTDGASKSILLNAALSRLKGPRPRSPAAHAHPPSPGGAAPARGQRAPPAGTPRGGRPPAAPTHVHRGAMVALPTLHLPTGERFGPAAPSGALTAR